VLDVRDFQSTRIPTMPARPEIWRKEDDWSKVKEREERKKRQNRLNQRAYRKRNEKENTGDGKNRPFRVERFRISELSTSSLEEKSQELIVETVNSLPQRDDNSGLRTTSGMNPISRAVTVPLAEVQIDSQGLYKSFYADPRDITPLSAALVASIRSKDPPSVNHPINIPFSSDHLIHLIHYNVYRALIVNKQLIKSQTYITKLDSNVVYPSHLDLCQGLSFVFPKTQASLPSNLAPTALQMHVPHSSWLDMFPYPKIRDNLIAQQYGFNQLDLCNDLWGEWFIADLGNLISPKQPIPEDDDDVTAGRTGLIVWGESWDPHGWEVTERFARKWAWILKGCEELFASTNRWRAERELPPLNFSALGLSSRSSLTAVGASGTEPQPSTGAWGQLEDCQQGRILSTSRISGMPSPSY
jgi:hypothetical protein